MILIGGTLIAALAGGYFASLGGRQERVQQTSTAGEAGKYQYAVGRPGIGQDAPLFVRPSTDGTNFNLGAFQDETVLLYFQEGVGCQPCWDQIKDIEKNWGQFQAAGVDTMVSITGDPLGALTRKVKLEGLKTPLLSDEGLTVSRMYTTNEYGMMGNGYNGHSFVLVGPDGKVRWRADYGGAPQYNMYIPVPNLLADMKRDLGALEP